MCQYFIISTNNFTINIKHGLHILNILLAKTLFHVRKMYEYNKKNLVLMYLLRLYLTNALFFCEYLWLNHLSYKYVLI